MWVLIFMIISALSIAIAYITATQTNYGYCIGTFAVVVAVSLIPILNIAALLFNILAMACIAEEYGVVEGTTLDKTINWLNKEL